MKASLKFREEQKPLFKAKIPLNILGLPFQSSLSYGGDTKSLSLGLSTFFESGPSFRFSYRPNDAFNPFSLLIKTGIGHFGSPIDAPFTMTAEFNTTSFSNSPRFFIHFKPRFGDFSVKKSVQSSSFGGNSENDGVFEDGSLEVIDKNGDFLKSKITSLPLKSSLESAVSGVEVGAKTELPIRNGAVLKLRWGIKFPEEGLQSFFNRTVKDSPHGIPLLVLNKIGIEHVAVKEDKKTGVVGPEKKGNGAEVAESCFGLKKEIETLRFENAQLGKVLEGLKVEFGNGKGVKRGKIMVGDGDCGGDVDGRVGEVSKV